MPVFLFHCRLVLDVIRARNMKEDEDAEIKGKVGQARAKQPLGKAGEVDPEVPVLMNTPHARNTCLLPLTRHVHYGAKGGKLQVSPLALSLFRG